MSVEKIWRGIINSSKNKSKQEELTHGYSTYGGSRLSAPNNLAILRDFSPFRPKA